MVEQETELNLDKSQSRQAATQKATWDRTLASRIGETFQWLLVPSQPSPSAAVEWQQTRLTGADTLAVRAARKLRNDGRLVAQFTPSFLRQPLKTSGLPMLTMLMWRFNAACCRRLNPLCCLRFLQDLRRGGV